MMTVPAGSYRMGSPSREHGRQDDESPAHEVTFDEPFAIGRYEVTVSEFSRFADETGYSAGSSCLIWIDGGFAERPGFSWRNPGFEQDNRHPATCMNWADAKAYVAWLSRHTGQAYRLPSESEWEYATRAGTATARYWGEGESDQCRHANGADASVKEHYPDWSWRVAPCRDDHPSTAPVGSYAANDWGLHDTLGNVWEWTEDCGHPSYVGAPADGTAWSDEDCTEHVLRGGAWSNEPWVIRAGNRGMGADRYAHQGLRVVRAIAASAVPSSDGLSSDSEPSLSSEPQLERATEPAPSPEQTTSASNDREYELLARVPPRYPPRALRRRIEGHVVLEFTVTATGRVQNIVVIETIPEGLFDNASRAAVEQWRYSPRMEDGEPVDTHGVRTRVVFNLPAQSERATEPAPSPPEPSPPEQTISASNDPGYELLERVPPHYPSTALRRRIEGHVVLEFTVTATGRVQNIVVIETIPEGLFDNASRAAVEQWRYSPRMEDGEPVDTHGVRTRVVFDLPAQSERATEPAPSPPEQTIPASNDPGYRLLERVPPRYPPRALRRRIEGYVVLEFTVTATGRVQNIVVIETIPEGLFDNASRAAVEQWRYSPRTEDGEPVDTHGIRTRVVFDLPN